MRHEARGGAGLLSDYYETLWLSRFGRKAHNGRRTCLRLPLNCWTLVPWAAHTQDDDSTRHLSQEDFFYFFLFACFEINLDPHSIMFESCASCRHPRQKIREETVKFPVMTMTGKGVRGQVIGSCLFLQWSNPHPIFHIRGGWLNEPRWERGPCIAVCPINSG